MSRRRVRPTIVSKVVFTPDGIGDIARRRIRDSARGDYRRRDLLRSLAVEIEHDDVRTLSAEECRNRPADAGAAPGDDSHLPAEIKHESQAWKYYTLPFESTIGFTLSVK